jgi:hypothetical protein
MIRLAPYRNDPGWRYAVTESREVFLERLKGLTGSGAPWHQIAAALKNRPEQSDARAWRELLTDIVRETGYAAVMLPRYVSLYNKISHIAGSPAELESLLPPSFTGGEIAVRLYARNPIKGVQALKDLRARRKTIDDLRDDLSKEPASKNHEKWMIARQERANAIAAAEALLSNQAESLFGAGCSIVGRPSLPYLSRNGYEVRSSEGQTVAGIDLYLPDLSQKLTQDPLEPIARSIVLSPYFPEFHLMFAAGFSEENLGRAEAVLDAFGARSIGMIVMPDENSISQYREASVRSDPDRAASYQILVDTIRDSARPDPSVEEDDEPPGPRLGM